MAKALGLTRLHLKALSELPVGLRRSKHHSDGDAGGAQRTSSCTVRPREYAAGQTNPLRVLRRLHLTREAPAIDKSLVAVTLRWLTIFWVVGYTLYVALGGGTRLSSVQGTLACLATLSCSSGFRIRAFLAASRDFAPRRQSRKAS